MEAKKGKAITEMKKVHRDYVNGKITLKERNDLLSKLGQVK